MSLLLVFFLEFLSLSSGQIKIQKKSEFITQKHDDSQLTKEIYTSMHELSLFFEKEKEYVEDLRTIVDKRLVTTDAQVSEPATPISEWQLWSSQEFHVVSWSECGLQSALKGLTRPFSGRRAESVAIACAKFWPLYCSKAKSGTVVTR